MRTTPPRVEFRATLELNGRTATGIEVPPEALARLTDGKRPAVVVTIAGHSFRTTVGSMGGRAMIPVSAATREAATLTAGTPYDVAVELDTAPREVSVPDDLQAELDADPELAKTFATLSRSRQRQLVEPIQQAKGADTRARRVAKAVSALSGDT